MEKELVRNENYGWGILTYGFTGNAILTPTSEESLRELHDMSQSDLDDAMEISDHEWESHVIVDV